MELASQLVLGALENRAPSLAERFARTIDIKHEHRHGGTEWIGLAAVAPFRRALKRTRNRGGILAREHASVEIQRVARLGDML